MTSLLQAAEERRWRRHLRADFGTWCELVLAEQGLRPARHHRLLIQELQAVADGETPRLMVSLPPGAAKSTFVSQLFPAWLLARGAINVLAVSHTATLAERFSGKVQSLVRDYGPALGYRLGSEARDLWTTTNGCEYRAAGAGAGISGYRSDFGLLDDVVRGREDADSDTIQDKIFDWFAADFCSRLRPGGAVVLVGTRWSEADLQGRLLDAEADRWRVINLPALAMENDPLGRAPGEPLWDDDDYGYGATLTGIRDFYMRTAQTRDWSALYQGRPAPAEGSLFRRAWLLREPMPDRERMRVYGASDYAVTADGGDYTVHMVAGMDPAGRLHLLDVWRAQASSDVWVEGFCDLIAKWKPLAWAEETGQIKAALGPFLDRRMRERRTYTSRRQFPTRGDKAVRAQSIIGRMALDGLRVRPDAPWIADLEAELLAFPAGKHDDQCLAEGTMIAMGDGTAKPIERVGVGDMVATPGGPCRVLASAVTSEAAALMEVRLSNGATLCATANHPIWVENKGFVRVDALCLTDRIHWLGGRGCDEARHAAKWRNTWGIATGAIRTASTVSTRGISTALSRAVASFTGTCGKTRTALSRLGMTSTIGMASPQTTISPTWNVSASASIGNCIHWWISNDSASISLVSVWSLLSGTQAAKGGHGTPATASGFGRAERPCNASVTGVACSSTASSRGRSSATRRVISAIGCALWLLPKRLSRVSARAAVEASRLSRYPAGSSARPHVDPNSPTAPGSPTKRPSSLSARAAASGLPLCIGEATAPRSAISIIGIRPLGRARVRNLAVEHAHAFYANGMLTHNCDALGLLGQLLDVMAPGTLPVPAPPPVDRWARRREPETSWKTI